MNYSAKPQFTAGSGIQNNNIPSGQNQQPGVQNTHQQQQQHQQQSKVAHSSALSGHVQMPLHNFPSSGIPSQNTQPSHSNNAGNHLGNPGSVNLPPINRQQFQQQQQQQFSIQQTLLFQQQQQQYLQQLQQQNQPQNVTALSRMVTEIQKQSNGNLSSQQLQQFIQYQAAQQATSPQLPALFNMIQHVAAQQKTFQQQVPPNTTITPVSRQNLPSSGGAGAAASIQSAHQKPSGGVGAAASIQSAHQKQMNYPQSKIAQPSKQASQSSSSQVRKNVPATTMPVALIPNVPSGQLTAASQSNYKSGPVPAHSNYTAVIPAASSTTTTTTTTKPQSSTHFPVSNPSLTITKASAPVGPTSVPLPSAQAVLLNKSTPVTTSPVPLKQNLPTATQLTVNINLNKSPVATNAAVSSSTVSPNNFTPSAPQKLSPKVVSPRTKQTPRKNTNPIKTTSHGPALQTVNSAVPSSTISATVTSTVASTKSADSTTVVTPKAEEAKVSAPIIKPTVAIPVATTASPNAKHAITSTTTPPATIPTVKKPSAETKPDSRKESPKAEKPVSVESKPVENKNVKSVVPQARAPATSPRKSDAQAKPVAASEKVSKTKETVVTTKSTQPASSAPKQTSVEKNRKSTASGNKSTSIAQNKNDQNIEPKAKRNRLRAIPYQSPIPEIELISKLTAIEASNTKAAEDKLILFYKNEFLAVRNAEGGFFLCQTMQNVYKSSPKIRIRWLSEKKDSQTAYELDFYDKTDIECVLTSVCLAKLSKISYELTKSERERIENILKKALDVEKGILPKPDVTEENPDGLDLSLFKDESQIEKKSPNKRKASPSQTTPRSSAKSRKSSRSARKGASKRALESEDDDDDYEPAKKKAARGQVKSPTKRSPQKKQVSKAVATPKALTSSAQRNNRAERSQRRNEKTELKLEKTPKTEKKAASHRRIADESAAKPTPEEKAEKQKGDEPKAEDPAVKSTKTQSTKPVVETKNSNSRNIRQNRD